MQNWDEDRNIERRVLILSEDDEIEIFLIS